MLKIQAVPGPRCHWCGTSREVGGEDVKSVRLFFSVIVLKLFQISEMQVQRKGNYFLQRAFI